MGLVSGAMYVLWVYSIQCLYFSPSLPSFTTRQLAIQWCIPSQLKSRYANPQLHDIHRRTRCNAQNNSGIRTLEAR